MGFENGKLLRVEVSATHDVDQVVNVWHYDLNDVPGPLDNDPQSLADKFRDDVIPKVKPLFTSDWTVQPIVVTMERDPQDPTAPRDQWTAGTAAAGTLSPGTDLLPRACTPIATLRTQHIGRRFRGRKFIIGTRTEGDQIAGVWQTTILATLQQYLDSIPLQPDLVVGTSSSTAKLCVYSRTQRAADLDPYASPVTSMQLRTYVRWLRSRAASI